MRSPRKAALSKSRGRRRLSPWAVGLHAAGVFSWPEWSQTLAEEIAELAERDSEDYFGCWLNALETLLTEKGVATRSELTEVAAAWREAYRTTPHGHPVRLDARAVEPAP